MTTRTLWNLKTARSSYVVSVGTDGRLENLHWGVPLSDEEADSLHTPTDFGIFPSSFSASSGDEVSSRDGRDLRTPSLDFTFPDGSRVVNLKFAEAQADGDTLSLVMTDVRREIDVILTYDIFPEQDVIRRGCRIVNRSSDTVRLSAVSGVDLKLPRRAKRITYLPGRWAADPQLAQTPLIDGITQLEGRGGFTGHRSKPWFAVDDGTANETFGEVWSASLMWSGSWKLAVERTTVEELHAQLGIHEDGLLVDLAPGESMDAPNVVLTYSAAGFGGVSDNWHDFVRDEVLRSSEPRPVLFNSWEAHMFDVNESTQLELAQRAAEIGCELFVVDDGWFRGRNDEHGGLGDWYHDPRKFPAGLLPLSRRVHSLGMKFGLWVEPEMVSPRSDLFREHPDWIYTAGGETPVEMRGQLVLDLGRAEVRRHIRQTLERLITDNELDYLKWDFNRPITVAGDAARSGGVVVRDHVRHLYEVLDEIREKFPHLLIEGCAGGGARADYGMLSHTDLVWPTDNTDPLDRIELQRAFSFAFPANVTSSWVTGSPSLLNGRVSSLEFRFHVAMCGVLGVGDDITLWDDADLELARRMVGLYKRNRDLVQNGRLSRLFLSEDSSAVQYNDHAATRAIVFAFAHGRAFGRRIENLRLRNLMPNAWYRTNDGRRYSGRMLASVGLPVDLTGDLASTVIEVYQEGLVSGIDG